MSFYAAYHRHPVNRAIHFVFVPAIVWSLMILLGMVDLFVVSNIAVTPAHLATLALLIYYLRLDFAIGVAATFAFTVLLGTALQVVARTSTATALTVFAVAFVSGWVVQFIGHGVWEKRRPALASNLFQVFVAPIFLVAETAFGLGLRRELHDDVRKRMQAHLPA
jgi:uncharacterized membrane protein YGL010W